MEKNVLWLEYLMLLEKLLWGILWSQTKVFDDPKAITYGIMDFDHPKVYSDTSFFEGLVECNVRRKLDL